MSTRARKKSDQYSYSDDFDDDGDEDGKHGYSSDS